METNVKPVVSCPRNAIAAIKRLLAKHGHAIAHRSGVYRPFHGNTQACTEGFRVSKLGCSKSITVEYTLGYGDGHWRDYEMPSARATRNAKNDEARALLTARGYVLDADFSGIKITCERYDF